jgi:hypothetical protein
MTTTSLQLVSYAIAMVLFFLSSFGVFCLVRDLVRFLRDRKGVIR